MEFSKRLLNWYDKHRRTLPWRETSDAYRILVSEIMLQQTRVETVKLRYEEFLERYPDASELAEASEEEVMKAWEGLGYYRRAKNLRRAAKEMAVKDPKNYEDLLALPGVGPYTAGAVASIAFGEAKAAVDGNSLRVFTRHEGIRSSIDEAKTKKEITAIQEAYLDFRRPGDFNQAIMDLGAVICVPNGAPQCEQCPVSEDCKALKLGIATELPVRSPKKPRKRKKKTVFLIEHNNRCALEKRSDGLLGGLYELYNTEGLLDEKNAMRILREAGFDFNRIEKMGEKKHIFTHEEWTMRGYSVRVEEEKAEYIWADGSELEDRYPIATAFRKWIDE